MVTRFPILLCVWIAITASPVWACGVLTQAEPKVGSIVQTAPDHLTLTFSQSIIPAKSHVTIEDTQGKPIPTGTLETHNDDSVILLPVKSALSPGKYKVTWDIDWKDCDSKTQGTYKFTIQRPE